MDNNMKLYLDCTDTSHCDANSGIQRVVRSVHRELGRLMDVDPVIFDPYEGVWRHAGAEERRKLDLERFRKVSQKRGARWTLRQRMASRMHRFLPPWSRELCPNGEQPSAFLVPEVFTARTGARYQALFRQISGPKVAIYYDAIAQKFPEWYSQEAKVRYDEYTMELLAFDGIAAISECSATDLHEFWDRRGVTSRPEVRALPLAVDSLPESEAVAGKTGGQPPVFLMVSTIEERKNHLALLKACEILWEKGYSFQLRLVGGLHRRSVATAGKKIRELQGKGFPLIWDGSISEEELIRRYREASVVVYPTLYEGFGLPVIEAMRMGKPVLMTRCGALAELVEGGGCHVLSDPGAQSIARGMEFLLNSPEERGRLAREAASRNFPTWEDYGNSLKDFIVELSQ